jgi:hypothetical protein
LQDKRDKPIVVDFDCGETHHYSLASATKLKVDTDEGMRCGAPHALSACAHGWADRAAFSRAWRRCTASRRRARWVFALTRVR